MFRIPKWSIIVFVCASVVAAFFIHRAKNPVEQLDFASEDETPSQYFEFEDPKVCSSTRQEYEKEFAKLPIDFTKERATSPADFPRSCLTYMLRSYHDRTANSQNRRMARCSSATSKPRRNAMKACVSETFVNTIYYTFADMATCLEIPQRDLVPKIFNESSFHPNILGGMGDAGIGQMTDSAIDHAGKRFEEFKTLIMTSEEPACRRLAPLVKDLKKVSPEYSRRCGFIHPAQNPITSFLYIGIKYHQDRDGLRRKMAEYDIVNRMKELGMRPGSYDEEQFEQVMLILSYNSGLGGAMTLLGNYLKEVKSKKGRELSREDFNFAEEALLYRHVDPESRTVRIRRGEKRENFSARLREFRSEVARMESSKTRYKPRVEAVSLQDAEGKSYSSYKVRYTTADLTFPAFIQLFQVKGARGYPTLVRRRADHLNKIFEEGTCVPESYLVL